LRPLPEAPGLLFMQGQLRPEDEYSVAVVGSRRASTWGVNFTIF
jgi:predicted Rossmann fold nucleotide-binding protein DprA/Smf involved in DNA uptake